MLQPEERVGVNLTAVLPEQFAEVVVLGQQCAAFVDTGSEVLVDQRLGVLTVLVLEGCYAVRRHMGLQVFEYPPFD